LVNTMIKRFLANTTLSVLIIIGFPLACWADAADPSAVDPSALTVAPVSAPDITSSDPAPAADQTNTPGPTGTPGPTTPTGPDANTYTYNPATGLWENAYYTWDPVTHQTAPKTQPTYSYNPATGRWDTTEWVYSPEAGKYVANIISIATPPNNNSTQPLANLTDQATASLPTNSTTNNNSTNGLFDLFYNASISNQLTSMAATGNASVMGNTLGGSALSGNALDVTNVMNLLQTVWNIQPAVNLLTFTSNINGNVVGDLMLNPGAVNATPLSTDTVSNQATNLTLNNRGNGLINNDITLGATSGNATVSGNTTAGNATTGAATAVADVVNVINSAISAGQSFLGVININGNLNGDILLPPNFLDQLIASGAPHATINTSQLQTNNVVADVTDTQTINNQVNLAAASGTANVAGNTTAGNATTGDASTNLTIFNLTGRQVAGTNSLLVFVNVLGSWVGLIMDAPAGSTTAALCGGSCQTSNTVENNLTLASDTNNTINNNINAAAQSGDAAVTHNTTAGNATSGNASASANLMNISNSNFNLAGWFGILFINVLGTWNGSFGVNTDAGNILSDAGFSTGLENPGQPGGALPAKVFKFVPGGINNNPAIAPLSNPGSSHGPSAILAASTDNTPPSSTASLATAGDPASSAATAPHGKAWLLPISAGAFVAMLIVGVEAVPEVNDRINLALLERRSRG
jgi:hypothetical protein